MTNLTRSSTLLKAPPVEIEDLGTKLRELYAWAWQAAHPSPDGKAPSGAQRLANLLGVSPQSISTWVNGQDVRVGRVIEAQRPPGMLPAKHLRPLCEDIFGIPQDVFTGSLMDFRVWLARHSHQPPLTWRALAAQATGHPGFHLRRRALPADFLGNRMGIAFAPDADEEPLPAYRIGEHVSIEMDLNGTDWAARAMRDAGIGWVLLAEDREQIACLCPSELHPLPPGPLPAAHTCWPPLPGDTPAEQWPHITAPTGRQALYALLSERPLPADSEIYRALIAGGALHERLLERYLRSLQQGSFGEWQMFQYRYAVQ